MPKVLIIEDEPFLVEIYQEKLESEGIKTVATDSVVEALNLFQKENPDLILLDILLPRDDGLYFIKRLREQFPEAKVPIIVFSNYDDPKTKENALFFGAKEYLIKTNYTPEELTSKIREYLKSD
jgi:CheY-like chemotaxis protein